MKIKQIHATNFQGLRDSHIKITAPIVMIAGSNGAGKSSLIEAIRLSISGEPERVRLKKDLHWMVSAGANAGLVAVETDAEMPFSYSLPDGKHSTPVAALPEWYRCALDSQRFASLDVAARRSMLFAVTKCSADAAEVSRRLLARGAVKDKIDRVISLLRSGFADAAKAAKEQESQAKGAWKAVTGELYGSKKAETWMPTRVSQVDAAEISALEIEIKALTNQIAESERRIGEAQAKARYQASRDNQKRGFIENAAQLPKLHVMRDEKAALFESLSAMLAKAKPEKKEQQGSLVAAMAQVIVDFLNLTRKTRGVVNDYGVVETWDMHQSLIQRADSCVSSYSFADMSEYANDDVIMKMETDIEALRRQISALDGEVAQAKHAAEQLASWDDNDDHIEDVSDAIEQARNNREIHAAAQARLNALVERDRQYKKSEDAQRKASAYHRDVCEWSLIADALSPDGIPAEILAAALKPVNDMLSQLSDTAHWSRVQITTDMTVTAEGRPYALLSESEKWRCDCLIALALSTQAEIGVVLIDRFDVLDLQSRGDALDLFESLAGQMQIIVAGTLKSAPQLSEAFQTVWLDASKEWVAAA